MIDQILVLSLFVFFVYYLLNHATLFERLRAAVLPVLPHWIANSLQCAFCFTWWSLAAFSLFTGWNPFPLLCPPVVLGMDLVYRRLRPPAEPPILPPSA